MVISKKISTTYGGLRSRRVAERPVSRRRQTERPAGDIRSENADMSNVKSCEIHDRRKFKGFHRCNSMWIDTAPKGTATAYPDG